MVNASCRSHLCACVRVCVCVCVCVCVVCARACAYCLQLSRRSCGKPRQRQRARAREKSSDGDRDERERVRVRARFTTREAERCVCMHVCGRERGDGYERAGVFVSMSMFISTSTQLEGLLAVKLASAIHACSQTHTPTHTPTHAHTRTHDTQTHTHSYIHTYTQTNKKKFKPLRDNAEQQKRHTVSCTHMLAHTHTLTHARIHICQHTDTHLLLHIRIGSVAAHGIKNAFEPPDRRRNLYPIVGGNRQVSDCLAARELYPPDQATQSATCARLRTAFP